MAYDAGTLIEASDFNTLATGSPNGTANINVPNINSLIGTGYKNIGYGTGLTLLSPVAIGDTVTAANWSEMITRITSMAANQGSSMTAMTVPAAGATIKAVKPIYDNIQKLYANASNSNRNSYTTSNYVTYVASGITTRWRSSINLELRVNFDGGSSKTEQLRVFFNRGGSIRIRPYYSPSVTPTNPTAAAVNQMMQALIVQSGSLTMTGATGGATILAGSTSFKGMNQQIGTYPGIITNPLFATVNKSIGYLDLPQSSIQVLNQLYTPSASDLATIPNYCSSYTKSKVKADGTVINGAPGNVLVFDVYLYQVTKSQYPKIAFEGYNMTFGAYVDFGIPPGYSYPIPSSITAKVNGTM